MTVVNQGRYSAMLVGGLIELNSAFLIWMLSTIAFIEYKLIPISALGFLFSFICIMDCLSMKRRGICHKINSLFDREPSFVLDDIDPEELAKNGKVILNE